MGAGGCHQQRLFLARQFAPRPRTRLFAQGDFQIAFDEAAFGPIHGGPADRYAGRDDLVTDARIGRQQDLRPLQLAHLLLAAAHQPGELITLLLVQLHPISYVHRCPPMSRAQMNPVSTEQRPGFTPRQGQYLAFIHAYTLVLGRPPAEADMQRFFRVTPPAAHQMVVTLEKAGFITRQPGVARSIIVLVDRKLLPELCSSRDQPVKTSVQRY